MPYQVRIHRDHPILFPHQCIECGSDQPDSSVLALSWGASKNVLHKHRHLAPACTACARRVAGRRRFIRAWSIAGGVLMLGVIVLIAESAPPGKRMDEVTFGLVFTAALVLVFGPLILWKRAHPLPVETVIYTAHSPGAPPVDFFDVAFRDEKYARHFAWINDLALQLVE